MPNCSPRASKPAQLNTNPRCCTSDLNPPALNRSVELKVVDPDLYTEGLTTFSFSFLEAAFQSNDIDDNIYKFIWFIHGESDLYGLQIVDTRYGIGEHLGLVRYRLEGLLNMPIDITDDRLSEDGELIELEDRHLNQLCSDIIETYA